LVLYNYVILTPSFSSTKRAPTTNERHKLLVQRSLSFLQRITIKRRDNG